MPESPKKIASNENDAEDWDEVLDNLSDSNINREELYKKSSTEYNENEENYDNILEELCCFPYAFGVGTPRFKKEKEAQITKEKREE